MLLVLWKEWTNECLTRQLYRCHSTSFSTWFHTISLRSDWLGVTIPLFSRCNRSFGVNSSGCQFPSNGPTPSTSLLMIFRTPFWRGVSCKTSLKVRFIILPSVICLLLAKLGFFLSAFHWPTGRNDTIACSTWRIISPGFFLNGTWSWPTCWRSDISSFLGVDGSRTRGVDVWLSLGNIARCLNRNTRNNLWRGTCFIPSDPTGCRFLFSLQLLPGGRDRDKQLGLTAGRDFYRVLLLVSAWRL